VIIPANQRLVAALLLFASLPLFSQEEENLDDLFSDPVADTVVVETPTDHLAQYVTSDTVVISGSFTGTGGILAGWTQWPDVANPRTGFDGTIGLTASATLNIDARPDPDFRLYGTMTTSMNPLSGQYTWTAFSLGELFVDYTLLGNVFFRMGNFAIAWGQGRLFTNTSVIMADVASGFALRANLPTLLDGVSLIGLMKAGYFETPLMASYKEIGYAAKVDKILWGTLLSFGARYQVDEGLNALVSVKKVVAGVDLLADFTMHGAGEIRTYQALAGFYKEWTDFTLYGEYSYAGSIEDAVDQSVGLAFGINNIFDTPIDLGFQWLHAFIDGSGTLTGGITWSPWSHITVEIGVPVVYGDDSSRYVAANADPAGRRIALALGLELSASF